MREVDFVLKIGKVKKLAYGHKYKKVDSLQKYFIVSLLLQHSLRHIYTYIFLHAVMRLEKENTDGDPQEKDEEKNSNSSSKTKKRA